MQPVQRALEIIQYHGVGQQFEHKREFPKRVDTGWEALFEDIGDREDVKEGEGEGEEHGSEEDAEARR
jgi:hypothetical protein